MEEDATTLRMDISVTVRQPGRAITAPCRLTRVIKHRVIMMALVPICKVEDFNAAAPVVGTDSFVHKITMSA